MPSFSFLENANLDDGLLQDVGTIIDDLTHASFWATTETEKENGEKSKEDNIFRPWASEKVSSLYFEFIKFLQKVNSNPISVENPARTDNADEVSSKIFDKDLFF